MNTHQKNAKQLSDELFIKGQTQFLSVGNECRLLDQRRTPGKIISLDMDGGYFEWEILDFEDKGKSWLVPFEQVASYQFKNEPLSISDKEVKKISERSKELRKHINIEASSTNLENTNTVLDQYAADALDWLEENSTFLLSNKKIDFQNVNGPVDLQNDFIHYARSFDFFDIEEKTAETQVMNPQSGDWIRGMQIVMAEMGLKPYSGLNFRSSKTFEGLGTKAHRKNYILRRLAFLRAFFSSLNLEKVVLYRGMATEWDWSAGSQNSYRFWSSWTFSHKVALDFCALDPDNKFNNSYLIKRAIPVNQLFMTFLETAQMNKQYFEAEAIVLHKDEDKNLW